MKREDPKPPARPAAPRGARQRAQLTELLLEVSRRTIYNRIREGKLQTIRTIGGSQRVLLSSLDEQNRPVWSAAGPSPQQGEVLAGSPVDTEAFPKNPDNGTRES